MADGAIFQDVPAKRFAEDGRRVNVVDAGRDGRSTVGHPRAFEEWFPRVPRQRARYILAFIGVDDRHPSDVDRGAHERFEDVSGKRRVYRYIESRSAIAAVWEMFPVRSPRGTRA